ncbi:solute carrier family 25 member 33-like [Scleropages formosus]|uniref:Solute carrier family 25 member 33-like n=1 Tax=Scleropages formosus TaxID=113540 RepID=A0A0P7TER6_SCLFO|nr:solute carrier family 25 member 33-like [Scleropages formosus]
MMIRAFGAYAFLEVDSDVLSRCSGTVAAIVTCPLEVLKTRLQSSGLAVRPAVQVQMGMHEGPGSLFRGLGPNLVGVAPSRAIYFATYSKSKEALNGIFVPNTGIVHMSSAGIAALFRNLFFTLANKKTRREKATTALQCARRVFQTEGVRGFYRGLSASYAGISETMICFLIYESLKKHLLESHLAPSSSAGDKSGSHFMELMAVAAFAKGCASCIAYPHEVIRTRLREEGSKYRSFFQTAQLVAAEEGYLAFYRGLVPHLLRQIPNGAIVLSTYELIIYLLGQPSQ